MAKDSTSPARLPESAYRRYFPRAFVNLSQTGEGRSYRRANDQALMVSCVEGIRGVEG